MKKILLTATALLCWSGALQAQEMVTLPAEDYKAILEQLKSLQQRVEVLEREKAAPPAAAKSVDGKVARLEKDVNTIYDTLDQVETKTLQDRVNFGVELRARMDNFQVDDYRFTDPNHARFGQTADMSMDNHWTNRFRLNLDTEVSRELQFHGRLAVYKNWADSDSYTYLSDPNQAHYPGDTNLKLDRAYVDWIPSGSPIPVAFTFGRQPSSEGPPFELKEDRPRQSTYPALLFDGESDGVVATVGMDRYLGLKNSGLRFFYAKGYQDDDDLSLYLDNGNLDDFSVYALFFESQIPAVDNSLMVLSYIRGEDFVVNPLNATANIGDMDLYGAHFQANDLMGSGFDLFFSAGLNESHPNGQTAGVYGGLLSSDGNGDRSGWALYTGLRYTVPYKPLKNPKLGFEYNYGSENWFSYTYGPTEVFNKLATRGGVYDLYYLQPFNDNLFMRTGYTLVNYNYSGSGNQMGDPANIDTELRNFYVTFDARF